MRNARGVPGPRPDATSAPSTMVMVLLVSAGQVWRREPTRAVSPMDALPRPRKGWGLGRTYIDVPAPRWHRRWCTRPRQSMRLRSAKEAGSEPERLCRLNRNSQNRLGSEQKFRRRTVVDHKARPPRTAGGCCSLRVTRGVTAVPIPRHNARFGPCGIRRKKTV
jgi:hypothetical protein